jgi:ABC-2 type transport system permease protein
MIRAILGAQLRSMRMFRIGSSRNALFSLAVALLWYGFWTGAGVFFFELTSEAPSRAALATWLPAGMLAIFLYWQIAPMVTASFGASLDLRKLLVYPIPRGKLFTVEVLLRLSTCGEMLLVLAGGAAGLVANPASGGWRAVAAVLTAALLFIVFNLLLAAGLRSLIERLLSHKRIREVFVLLLVLATALPRLLVASGVRYETFERAFSPARVGAWPWSAAARLAVGDSAAIPALWLVAWCAAAWVFARWQFARSLRFDAQAARATSATARTGAGAVSERFFRLPRLLLPDPLAAIVEKELRSLSRTPRFRTVFVMGFTFGLLVWLPLIMGRGSARNSGVADNFLVIVSLYAFTLLGQVSYWNSFGFDRTAAQAWFVLPPPLSRALAGKNLAAALFILLEVAAVTGACLLLRVPIAPERVLEAFLVTPVAALYMLALGNLSSVHFPRAMNPERVSQGGAASRFQGLLFLLYPLALLPVLLAYLARWALASAAAFYLVLAFAGALGAAVYWIAMESAVEAARARRETLLAELSKGEGPVVTE